MTIPICWELVPLYYDSLGTISHELPWWWGLNAWQTSSSVSHFPPPWSWKNTTTWSTCGLIDYRLIVKINIQVKLRSKQKRHKNSNIVKFITYWQFWVIMATNIMFYFFYFCNQNQLLLSYFIVIKTWWWNNFYFN